jgi:hypothetical protein
VKETLGQATSLTPTKIGIIFHMKQEGSLLIKSVSKYGVELQVLEQFLPQEAPLVIKEAVVRFEAQIETLFSQGL